ncbi:MAG: IS66 family transposase zinc-finger binding domain-containing protein [Burkholderia sp.]
MAARKQHGSRKPLNPALPREVIRYEIPADQLICPVNELEAGLEMGVELSKQLDIIPQQIRVIRHERVQYACEICDHGLKVAPVLCRFGGDISRNTMAATQGDETNVQVLKEPGHAAQSKSAVWVQMNAVGPPVRLYSYAPWPHIEQGDVYDVIAKQNKLIHLGMHGHMRGGTL